MNMNMKTKILSFLLIFSIFTVLVNNSVFIHSHILNNGKIVTHAHPFESNNNSTNSNNHNHTNSEYFILDIIFNLFFTLLALFVFFCLLINKQIKTKLYQLKILLSNYTKVHSIRPPPALA